MELTEDEAKAWMKFTREVAKVQGRIARGDDSPSMPTTRSSEPGHSMGKQSAPKPGTPLRSADSSTRSPANITSASPTRTTASPAVCQRAHDGEHAWRPDEGGDLADDATDLVVGELLRQVGLDHGQLLALAGGQVFAARGGELLDGVAPLLRLLLQDGHLLLFGERRRAALALLDLALREGRADGTDGAQAHVVFRPSRGKRPLERSLVRLDAKTQLLYSGKRFFINGEPVSVRERHARALRKLADSRVLHGGALAAPPLADLICGWRRLGYLHFERP